MMLPPVFWATICLNDGRVGYFAGRSGVKGLRANGVERGLTEQQLARTGRSQSC